MRQEWRNQLITHRRVAISLFSWVMWFNIFWYLGYLRVYQKVVFWFDRLIWRACVVDLLYFLVLNVVTRVKLSQCIQAWWYQPFYICSSSLVKFRKTIFRSSLQPPPNIVLWENLSGIPNLPCLCKQWKNHQQISQIWLGGFCGTIVLGCFLFGKIHILQVILLVINLWVSRNVLVHTFLWWFQRIQDCSLILVGCCIHRQFFVVFVWLGFSFILDDSLGYWGRFFWHQLSWILNFLLTQQFWIDILLLLGMLFFYNLSWVVDSVSPHSDSALFRFLFWGQ